MKETDDTKKLCEDSMAEGQLIILKQIKGALETGDMPPKVIYHDNLFQEIMTLIRELKK